jgi:hypothetical protein
MACLALATLGFPTFGCRCQLLPAGLDVDAAKLGLGLSDADLLLEPDETVVVAPSWEKSQSIRGPYCIDKFNETGHATQFTGPPGATYTIVDDTAHYREINQRTSCIETLDCYELRVSAPARPLQHWDASFVEALQGVATASTPWTFHIGDSFHDVPRSHLQYRGIETLLHRGVLSGCTDVDYCPDQRLSRADAAGALARSVTPAAYILSSGTDGARSYRCTADGSSLFDDVLPTDPRCKFIHFLDTRVSLACAPDLFCPSDPMQRATMAHAIASLLTHDEVPSSYGPDPDTGRSYDCDSGVPDVHFSDAAAPSSVCRDAHYLWAKGLVEGCSESEFCPSGVVTKSSAAEFLVRSFGLTLSDNGRPLVPPHDCSESNLLCLQDARYVVQATWRTPDGRGDFARVVPGTANSGFFFFEQPENIELAVKVLDGCGVNGHPWVFVSGLTNLEVVVTVTDAFTGQSATYYNLQGVPFQPIVDTATFEDCPTGSATASERDFDDPGEGFPLASAERPAASAGMGCVTDELTLCLSDRFRVEATWETASQRTGPAQAVSLSAEAGYFWFFDPTNVELVVKELDACGIGRGEWFFAAGMTTVGVELRVTDTRTGEIRTYSNPVGAPFLPIQDTAAFSQCAP